MNQARSRDEALLALLRVSPGSTEDRLARALDLLAEQLDMDSAFVSRFRDGSRFVTHVNGGRPPEVVSGPMPVEETICHLVATGSIPPLVPDADHEPLLVAHQHRELFGLGAYVGVPLTAGGAVVGAVCATARSPRPELRSRDVSRLASIGTFIGELLEPAGGAAPAPAGARTGRDAVVRPVLQLLHQVTGMESVYLTAIDWSAETARVEAALNTGALQVPEGHVEDWAGTLARRSLEQGRPALLQRAGLPDSWRDSFLVRDLGVRSFVSVPLRDAGDAVTGTLCAASRDLVELDDDHLASLDLIARALSDGLRRERAAPDGALPADASAADGLKDRTAARRWLTAVASGLRPEVEQLAAARITGVGGTDVASVLAAVRDVVRQGDLRARTGPGTVLVASVVPPGAEQARAWEDRLAAALGAGPGTTARLQVTVLSDDASGAAVEALLGGPEPAAAAVPVPRVAEPAPRPAPRAAPRHAPAPAPALPVSAPWTGPATLDQDTLEELRGLGDEDFAQIYGDFARDLPPSVEELLSAAYPTRRPDAVSRLAHRLKGGAASVGAHRLAALLGEVEERAADPAVPLTDLMNALAAISAEAEDVSAEIAALLRPASAG